MRVPFGYSSRLIITPNSWRISSAFLALCNKKVCYNAISLIEFLSSNSGYRHGHSHNLYVWAYHLRSAKSLILVLTFDFWHRNFLLLWFPNRKTTFSAVFPAILFPRQDHYHLQWSVKNGPPISLCELLLQRRYLCSVRSSARWYKRRTAMRNCHVKLRSETAAKIAEKTLHLASVNVKM